MGLLVMTALGIGLGLVLKRQLEHRALERAVQQAQMLTQLGFQPHLRGGDLRYPNALERLEQFDDEIGKRSFADAGILEVKLFNSEGRLVYSDDRTNIGEYADDRAGIDAALDGGVVRELEHGTDDDGAGERVLEVYVPVRLSPAGAPAGVLELYVSYEPVAETIRADVTQVFLLLAGGLVFLFGALYRIVARASRQLHHQALHDALTDLPNRTLLHRRAERALRGDGLGAMLLIDLDRFKEVNDTLGHDHGDELLIEVAGRLKAVLRRGDTLARLGGDEFAVLLDGVPDRSAVVDLAMRLQDALRRPFALRGVAVELEASVGIALYPEHGTTVGALLQRADVAMYDAKRGHHGIATYTEERDPYSEDRLGLLAELRRALSADELVLHYQPKVDLASDAVVGVEALVRWEHPSRGLLSPDAFIDVAEESGLIVPIGAWVLAEACRQVRAWNELLDAARPLRLSVNLSARQLAEPGLLATVRDTLLGAGIEPHRLHLSLEITEALVLRDPEAAAARLGELRALGVQFAIDDFGTGYSSLAYLRRFPVSTVKIDSPFVAGLGVDDHDEAIVSAIVRLAHVLGLRVVAEGVETELQLAHLRAMGCDYAQGFLLGRPEPAERMDFLRSVSFADQTLGPAPPFV
jgi:diguanylate cyclase (GGDEF)-like protein